MEITWLGHSSLRIRSGTTTLVTDPYADSVGFSMAAAPADIITVSNGHPHHSHSAGVQGDPKVLTGPGAYEIANFYITGLGTPGSPLQAPQAQSEPPAPPEADYEADEDDEQPEEDEEPESDETAEAAPRVTSQPTNTVFSFRVEGLTVCHLGDITRALTPRQAEQLSQAEILIVPVGGHCTISIDAVPQLINLIGPKIVIPVHYRSDGSDLELEPLDRFLQEMGISEVSSQNRLNITSTNLPRDMTIIPMNRMS